MNHLVDETVDMSNVPCCARHVRHVLRPASWYNMLHSSRKMMRTQDWYCAQQRIRMTGKLPNVLPNVSRVFSCASVHIASEWVPGPHLWALRGRWHTILFIIRAYQLGNLFITHAGDNGFIVQNLIILYRYTLKGT